MIKCRAAVAWGPKEKLKIENVEVAPPSVGEVRIKVRKAINTSLYLFDLCH